MSKNPRVNKINEEFKRSREASKADNGYSVGSEGLSVNDKLELLNEIGRPELVDLFKDWKPRTSNKRKRGAPLDQRVAITVTDQERFSLNKTLEGLKKEGSRVSISQFIRNRCLGQVKINDWRDIAEKALEELEYVEKHSAELITQRKALEMNMDEEDDRDTAAAYGIKVEQINERLAKIVAQNEKRTNRLTGRMSLPEAEKVKWRAQRLCISTSDYLRMMIFDLEPDSIGDSHMSLDAKRRFYVSIIEVSQNGWGSPPSIYECTQCENYADRISELETELKVVRDFS